MEKITKALERAYAQQSGRSDPKVAVITPHAAPEPARVSAVEFTDTVMFRTPVIDVDPRLRENERLLPPGATGPHGAAYKMLRTQVLKRLDQLGANTLGVISAGAGEGKTLTAINLAISIAADPARTALLVDFDLRSPKIAQRLGHEPAVGIEECLEHGHSPRDAMFKINGYERLTIVAAKQRAELSSELLASPRAAALVNEMRTRYANRVLIFDMPPALEADDALSFARHMQAGLLVIGEGRTRRDNVARTLQLLADLPFVGTVLNGSREKVAAHY